MNSTSIDLEAVFRLQIVGPKRQVTIPVALMKQLRLNSGDFIEVTVVGTKIVSAKPLKTFPVEQLTDEQLEAIAAGQSEIAAGNSRRYSSIDELRRDTREGIESNKEVGEQKER